MTTHYKKETINLKDLPNLVPKEYLPKINLLFNKDVPKEPRNADELLIYRLAQLKETDMQKHFHNEANALDSELKAKNKFNELIFVQNDNGDSAGGQLTQIQRINLYKRKKAEGSKAGFPDSTLFIFSQNIKLRDTAYCEVKRIDEPSGIRISKDQLKWFLILNNMGFDSYITNNPIFFRDVVLGKIKKDYFK